MEGKKLFNNQNIYIESDYENIIVVDPNKVFESDGTVKERLINHEEMVMYVDLSAQVIPRTKLAIGSNFDDSVQNIRVGVMESDNTNTVNFSNPKGIGYLDDSWTDHLTGDKSLTGGGLNQTRLDIVGEGENKRVKRTITNQENTQLLGIESINISISSVNVPEVTIEMVDVQGRVLFEQGENSPYSAFMQMPHPLFTLTIKGYLGKAVQYELMLRDFKARFDSSSGNYKITTKYIARTYAILSDTNLKYLYALPSMYKKTTTIGSNTTSTDTSVNSRETVTKNTTRGLDKIYEVFDAYKSKGLISDDMPPMTLSELIMKLDNFERYVMESYGKEDISVLTDMQLYENNLNELKRDLFSPENGNSWINRYLDTQNVFVQTDTYKGKILYKFKKDLTEDQKETALTVLKQIIDEDIKKLNENVTFGNGGEAEIDGNKINTELNAKFKPNDIKILLYDIDETTIDFFKTYLKRTAGVTPNDAELAIFTQNIINESELDDLVDETLTPADVESFNNMFFHFGETYDYKPFSNTSFLGKWSNLSKEFEDKKKIIEDELSKSLSKKVTSANVGLGFKPTIKNIMAVICASADAFFRIMDDVHEKAWSERKNPVRISSILESNDTFSVEKKDSVSSLTTDGLLNNESVVYPWPQYMEIEVDEDGQQEYVNKYPGERAVISKTQGFRYDIWPEIEFVEEYIRGAFARIEEYDDPFTSNESKERPYIPINSIEFPYSYLPYIDKSITSIFYEFFERTLVTTSYSNFIRENESIVELYSVFGDIEFENIKESIQNSPDAIAKLKQIKFNYDNIEKFLRLISLGGSWEKYIRDVYVNGDLNNLLNKDYGIYDESYYDGLNIRINKNIEGFNIINDYVKSTKTNSLNIFNVYPTTNLEWISSNTSNGNKIASLEQANDTTKMFSISEKNKVLISFDEDDTEYVKRPFTNFRWLFNKYNDEEFNNSVVSDVLAIEYFNNRTEKNRFLTESTLTYDDTYGDTNNLIPNQTTSLLNTPYFVNAIIDGTQKERIENENPYVSLGYLYLNSLPLSTLSEKFKTKSDGVDIEENYIFATLNKFSSIHKLPYFWILKYGSVWHRYKKFVETSNDILDDVWKDFDYVKAYDPITENEQKLYNIQTYDGANVSYVQKSIYTTINDLGETEETITLKRGMYPKVINDIYYYFTRKDLFSEYTDEEFETVITNNKLKVSKTNNTNTFKYKGYDNDNLNRNLFSTRWYQYFDIEGNKDFDDYNKKVLLTVPSCGNVVFKQANFECFDGIDGTMTNDFIDNSSVYNGTVRCLWEAPNHGYFDNDKIIKPTPLQYIKSIDNETSNDNAFNLNGEGYSNIEDLFSVFTKEMLDDFEKHFLNFCKKPEKYNPSLLIGNGETFEDYLKNIYNVDNVNTLTISDEEFFELKSKFQKENNIFTSDDRTYTFGLNLFSVMKSIFIVEKPDTEEITDNFVVDISKKQMKGFLNKHKSGYLSTDVILKIGNPNKYNRRVFNSFSNLTEINPVDKIDFGTYEEGTLPTATNDVTVLSSFIQNPEAWLALKLEIGEYENEGLSYKDTGSYITDFFIDFNINFNKGNIEQLSHIIKMYASKKVEDVNYGTEEFYSEFNDILNRQTNLHRDTLNHIFLRLNSELPEVEVERNPNLNSRLDGDTGKLEIWEIFRTMNDKWVSGQDFKNRTIFEDFLFLDRANRDVGDKVMINIEKLRTMLKGDTGKYTLYDVVSRIFKDNNFTFMPTPVYVNFYGLDNRVKDGEPIPQDIPNDLFGTFMEVDTRNSRPKMLGIYVGKPSEHIDDKGNNKSRRLDDSFDLTRASANPLIENQINKTDYANSNKCVGFTVDFGTRNQGIFKTIDIDMSQYKNTSETYDILEQLGNLSSLQSVAQESQSMYTIYKSRSFNCKVSSLGNAMIQPTMYFNLRHVPMFNGPYLIINVNHSISGGQFTTQFEGVRIPTSALKIPDKLAMSVNKELLKTFQRKIFRQSEKQRELDELVLNATNNLLSGNLKPANESECEGKTEYADKPFTTIVNNVINSDDLKTSIESTSLSDDLKRFIYGVAYIETGLESGGFGVNNNNIFNIRTDINHGTISDNFESQVCLNNGDYTLPYASFGLLDNAVKFMEEKYQSFDSMLGSLYDGTTNEAKAYGMTVLWASTWKDDFGYGKTANEIRETIVTLMDENPLFVNTFDKTQNKFIRALNMYNS